MQWQTDSKRRCSNDEWHGGRPIRSDGASMTDGMAVADRFEATVRHPPPKETLRKHLTIVTVDVSGLLTLAATCSTVKGDLLIAGYGYGSTSFTPGTMPNLIGVTSGAVTQPEAVMVGLKHAENYDVVTVLKSGEYFPAAEHPCFVAVANWTRMGMQVVPDVVFQSQMRDIPGASAGEKLKTVLDSSDVLPSRIFHILAHVEDRAGLRCRNYSIEARTVLREWAMSNDIEFGDRGFQRKGMDLVAGEGRGGAPWAVLPEAPILHQPIVAAYLDCGDAEGALRLSKNTSVSTNRFDRRLFILARAEVERREAFEAFKVLFKHYSFHEELWRLKEWMKLLPYDLEESPEMEEYRRLLEMQVGHLKLGSDGPKDWYANGSPSEVTNVTYVMLFVGGANLAPRFMWLISECRKRGFKKVVEFGSVDGVSLFPLLMVAPDIEWHGVEVNKAAVEHGNKVAKEAGVWDKFHLHHAPSFGEFEAGVLYDAAVVFEVLEHNDPDEGRRILKAAESAVKPGGRVFISTPCGNWSAHDESTRIYPLQKDHINVFTEKRMREFLKDKKDVFVEVVENPEFSEGNSNVQASYVR